MKIVAQYKNEQLQTKGWKALAKYRPKRLNVEDTPALSIELSEPSGEVVNKVIQDLKKSSTPFLIAKERTDTQQNSENDTTRIMVST